MARIVSINGVEITIDTGVVPARSNRGPDKKPVRLLCEALKAGESAVVLISPKDVSRSNIAGIGKVLGKKFSQRPEGDGTRIFCLADNLPIEPKKKYPRRPANNSVVINPQWGLSAG